MRFYDEIRKAKTHKNKLSFRDKHALRIVQQYVRNGWEEDQAKSMHYLSLLLDLKNILQKALALGEQLKDALEVERQYALTNASEHEDSIRSDVFICHASEDKDEVARPLAEALRERGLKVWYDEYVLRVGDSLRRQIDKGLTSCRFGIVILSPNFFAKEWPQRELDGLVSRETIEVQKLILPIWHNISKEEVAKYSPTLADRVAVETSKGLEHVVNAIHKALSTTSSKHLYRNYVQPAEIQSRSLSEIGLAYIEAEEVEDLIAELLVQQNPILIRRALKKEFDEMVNFLKGLEQHDEESLRIQLNERFLNFLEGLFVVWVSAIEYDELGLAEQLVDRLHGLYVNAFSMRYPASKEIDSLWLQIRIMSLVYCLGAYAVLRKRPKFARLLMDKDNPFSEPWRERSWFRYITTMVARRDSSLCSSFLRLVLEFAIINNYVFNSFESEENLINALCQFDFLQCAYTLASKDSLSECYPSFGAFYKYRIEPIVECIIRNYEEGSWIPPITQSRCIEIINSLDQYAAMEHGFNSGWTHRRWSSRVIVEFLQID